MPFTIFIHGLESSNKGTKSVYFKERVPGIIIPNFRGDLQERMQKLRGILFKKSNIRLVGSSFGGLMATIFAMENEQHVDRLILLAPAINLLPYADHMEKKISVPVRIYHGKSDDVIPFEEVASVAKKIFTNLSFHTVEDDHFLHKTFKTIAWDRLLS